MKMEVHSAGTTCHWRASFSGKSDIIVLVCQVLIFFLLDVVYYRFKEELKFENKTGLVFALITGDSV